MKIEEIREVQKIIRDSLISSKKIPSEELNASRGKLTEMIQKRFSEIFLENFRNIKDSKNDFESFVLLQQAYSELMILLKDAARFVEDVIIPKLESGM